MKLEEMYREIEALGGAVVMDDYDEGHTDGLGEALAILRKYGFGVDMAPVKEERAVSTIEEPADANSDYRKGWDEAKIRQNDGKSIISFDGETFDYVHPTTARLVGEMVEELRRLDSELSRYVEGVEGFEYVPLEPTPAMLERGAASCSSLTVHGARAVYQAMISEMTATNAVS